MILPEWSTRKRKELILNRMTLGLASAPVVLAVTGMVVGACALKPSGNVRAPDDNMVNAETVIVNTPADETDPAKRASEKLVELKIGFPKPAFGDTPKNPPPDIYIAPPTGKPRPPVLVPPGVTCISTGKSVTSSDEYPIVGELKMVTDACKDAASGCWVELGPGTQWVQIDLGQACEIHCIVLWHYHRDARVYRDVIVKLADADDFLVGARTVFNNDIDNSSGLSIGKDYEFFETSKGKIIRVNSSKARYVRLYSNGSTADDLNHYTEVEVYGKAGKAAATATAAKSE